MRTMLVAAVAAVIATGCGSDSERSTVSTAGTVEGRSGDTRLVWVIRAENGIAYAPTNLPAGFQVDGARVRVLLVERKDLATVVAAVPADIIGIEEASCAGVVCGATGPTITVEVLARPQNASIANLSTPSLPVGTGPPAISCPAGGGPTTCTVDARVAGAYSFDVVVPGSPAVHVEVRVRPYEHVPGVCCEPEFVPVVVRI